jgi:Fe-S cluster assembly protein SufD
MTLTISDLKGKSKEEIAKHLSLTDDLPPSKEAALNRLAALGLPSKKSEEYRYFDVEKLLDQSYELHLHVPKEPRIGEKIIIENGIIVEAPKGMRVYYDQCDALDLEHFDPIYYLSHLLSPHVIKIDLDGDAEVELIHRYTHSGVLLPYRIVLFNQANRHATVYETFETEEISESLILYGYDMHIAPDSTLRVIKTQSMSGNRYAMIASHRIKTDKRANAVLKSFDLGGDQALQLIKVDLESYAHVDAGHLLYLNHASKRGTVSKIIHKGEHATSQQEAKNILDGDARGIFDALIKVEHSAKWTKAHQNSKAILLHDDAYMAAKPQLEIYIDELEASHGATTGQLDPKQLFYLRSRGINYIEARKMLVIAFANTLIETVKDTRHQERIKNAFEESFYQAHSRETKDKS